jgi:hypothetical protein
VAKLPYRIPDPPEATRPPPSVLVYPAVDSSAYAAIARSAIRTAAGCLVVGAVADVAGVVVTAALLVAVTTAFAIRRARRARGGGGVVMRVERGVLAVVDRPSRELVSVRLEQVANVTLDSKTIRKVQQGSAMIPAVRFIDSKVGPELDVARIVLEVNGVAEPIRLSEAYLPHMDSVEWLGKIRSFLRSHGWVPEDEREDAI